MMCTSVSIAENLDSYSNISTSSSRIVNQSVFPKVDSDNDGYSDAYENVMGTDPMSLSSKPQAKTNAFSQADVSEKLLSILSPLYPGWLPNTSDSTFFKAEGGGIQGFGLSFQYISRNINWSILDDDLYIDTGEVTNHHQNLDYPYDDLTDLYGESVVEQLKQLRDRGVIESQDGVSLSIERLPTQYIKSELSELGYSTTEVVREKLTLQIPEYWDWQGELPTGQREYSNQVDFVNHEQRVITPWTESQWMGKKVIPLYRAQTESSNALAHYEVEFHEGGNVTENDESIGRWSLSSGNLILTMGQTQVTFNPIFENEVLLFVNAKHWELTELQHVYSGQITVQDSYEQSFASQLDTDATQSWASAINYSYASYWDELTGLPKQTWGYQFISDSELRYGIAIEENNGTHTLDLGTKYRYTSDDETIVMDFTDGQYRNKRIVKRLTRYSESQWLVLEERYVGYDQNQDDEVSDSELRLLIAPRLNIWQLTDFTDWPEAWAALSDFDGDGLKDIEEEKLGTDPALADTDSDGLSDKLEVEQGTSPHSSDSDSDGYTDAYEIEVGTDPNNAEESPAFRTGGFTTEELADQQYIVIDEHQQGWLPISSKGIRLAANNTGSYTSGSADRYLVQNISWSVIDDDLVVQHPETTSFRSFKYPFDDIRQEFGDAAADQVRSLFQNGDISPSVQVQIDLMNYTQKIRRLDGQTAQVDSIYQTVMSVPESWNWQGALPKHQNSYRTNAALIDLNTVDTQWNSENVEGQWVLPNKYAVKHGSSYDEESRTGVYSEQFDFNSNRIVERNRDRSELSWSIVDDSLELNTGNETWRYTKLEQSGNLYHVAVEYLVDGQISELFTGLATKKAANAAGVNLVTQLPQVYSSTLNHYHPSQWQQDGTLNLDAVWGYQFKDNGEVRRGIRGVVSEEGEDRFEMGLLWNYTQNDRNLLMTWSGSSYNRELHWELLNVDELGRVLVQEYSTLGFDSDQDGVIEEDEVGILYAPRLNVMSLKDMSQYPQAWNSIIDSDNDGLNDYVEQDFGSDPRLFDTDGDGLSDAQEKELGTSPTSVDSDGDGFTDQFEVEQGSDPTNSSDTPAALSYGFSAEQVVDKNLMLHPQHQESWLPSTRPAFRLNQDGSGVYTNGDFQTHAEHSVQWQTVDHKLQINLVPAPLQRSLSYPFDDIEQEYGAIAADQLRALYAQGINVEEFYTYLLNGRGLESIRPLLKTVKRKIVF
ncbi:hypothetical protein SOPP22_05925 [Shewanella sp. OPT22]|nr:hypothetical protein SOPP22_05925 [Shewanella sp. OPT22]